VDHWTGELVEGSRHVVVSPPLDRIPLFVRHGAVIPVAGEADRVAGDPEITLMCYGGAEGRTTIKDLDGTTTVAVRWEDGRPVITTEGPKRITRAEAVIK